jgi:glycosyltransferase involved in cell wall biosynthesis
MTIFNVMLSKDLGGIQQSFLNYNFIINNAGSELISIVAKDSKISSRLNSGFYEISNISNWDFFGIFSLIKLIKKYNPKIVIAHGNRAIRFLSIARKFTFKKFIIVGVAHNYSYKYLAKCDYIFAISAYMKNFLISLNFYSNKISILPNIINSHLYNFKNDKNRNKIPTIGVIARFVEKKGVDVAVNAIKILIDRKIKVRLLIGGDGVEESNIKSLIIDKNLSSHVEMIGWVSKIEDFFYQIDIFCLPSREEPFGIIILEAMLSNTPIISTRSEGPREILKDKEDAILVDIDSPVQIADAIEFYINNPEIAKKYSSNALLSVNERYDINAATKLFKEIIDKI